MQFFRKALSKIAARLRCALSGHEGPPIVDKDLDEKGLYRCWPISPCTRCGADRRATWQIQDDTETRLEFLVQKGLNR